MALIRHRETARILLRAATGRYLLMFSLWSPESGLEPRWVSPGGGVEPGEDLASAAVRELLEETGLPATANDLGQKLCEIEFNQPWPTGDYETGVAHFFRLETPFEFELNRAYWTPEEHRDILDVRWWLPADLIESGQRVGPPGLATLLAELG